MVTPVAVPSSSMQLDRHEQGGWVSKHWVCIHKFAASKLVRPSPTHVAQSKYEPYREIIKSFHLSAYNVIVQAGLESIITHRQNPGVHLRCSPVATALIIVGRNMTQSEKCTTQTSILETFVICLAPKACVTADDGQNDFTMTVHTDIWRTGKRARTQGGKYKSRDHFTLVH